MHNSLPFICAESKAGTVDNQCANVRDVLENLADADITNTARLIAVLEACGITDASTIQRLTATGERMVRKAKAELRCRNQSAGGTGVPEPEFRSRNQSAAAEPECRNSGAVPRVRATKESPSEILISKRDNKQTDSREAVCLSAPPAELKSAFNGSTENMLRDAQSWLGPQAQRYNAEKWLAALLSANGADPVCQAYAQLAAAQAQGVPIASPIRYWSKTAATIKAGGSTPAKQAAPKQTLAALLESKAAAEVAA